MFSSPVCIRPSPVFMCIVCFIALKQTQAVDPQIKAETQAEASTESPEPVSIEAVQSRSLA